MSETSGSKFLQEALPPTVHRRGAVGLALALGLLGLVGLSLLVLGGLRR